MGGDAPPQFATKPQGFCVSVQVDDSAQAERIFRELGEGEVVQMPIGETFFARRFGVLSAWHLDRPVRHSMDGQLREADDLTASNPGHFFRAPYESRRTRMSYSSPVTKSEKLSRLILFICIEPISLKLSRYDCTRTPIAAAPFVARFDVR
jgi:hypothetical protein